MKGAVIGLVGAYGSVGRQVAQLLAPRFALRLGGRDRQRAEQLNQQVGARAEVRVLDLWQPQSLADFCAGCALVINCAGPSYRILDRVARAALAAGADYLDVGGDDPLHERLSGQVPAGRRVLLSAGMLPGLSGLFPRLLAQSFQRVDAMRCYAGGLGRLSATAAEDFLLSLGIGFGQAQCGWCEGRVVRSTASAGQALQRDWLPPAGVQAYPYLSTEQQRLFADVAVRQGQGFNLFEGAQLAAALQRVQGSAPEARSSAQNIAALVRASALDVAGRRPYQLLAVEIDGLREGRQQQASAWLRAVDGSRLTGSVAAFCALHWAHLPEGLHYAAQVLDPAACLEQLQRWLPDTRVQLPDFTGVVLAEEGVL
ncbi:saccharopine dehydrogenase NADP-binding domain-containing protein [Pseudomonas chlororaphis]|uniref:saccharopine dehydrogenase NADP-binding domain-containing protein n=1 Tax=Pseudomonas chlororaphis TaxID=587753 RepID=UPI00209AA4B8|nr:saccharopine dehydrogenase NADP-binding domain-containing protein [Pseudomonas chlororaphis]MCO7610621.1 saccharopine dehydrogenase NADP-binding domain-containing protein [Pseudomonas chlororaphis]